MKSKKATTKRTICKILKERRLLLGMSVPELSKKTGVDKSSIYYYERCETEPLAKNFIKICDALGLNISDFI